MALYINGNKTGGGGGNSNMRELTQAEYDALTTEEKNNGTVYYITDSDEGNGGYQLIQPIIYSEDEREVGVWIDGKPLYQKTLVFNNISRGRVDDLHHNIANIDQIAYCNWQFVDDTGTILIGSETTSTSFWCDIFNVSSTGISYRLGTEWTGMTILRTTLQYTKITDVAGSGKWTPQGTPAIHYNTEEQVIGTWIDGSTVYEKTFELSNSIIVNNSSWTSTGINKENINKIICCNGMTPDGTCWGDLCATPNVNSYISLLTTRNGDTEEVKWFTIQYTKTTT